jgi:hypothetical protein
VTTRDVPLPLIIEGVPRPPNLTATYDGREITLCRSCSRRLRRRIAREVARDARRP